MMVVRAVRVEVNPRVVEVVEKVPMARKVQRVVEVMAAKAVAMPLPENPQQKVRINFHASPILKGNASIRMILQNVTMITGP